ncbi:MAG TPA: response regulator [Herpetosiphonaceae bacterium]
MRILVAEDNAAIRMMVQQVLEDAGHEVVLAENGLEALQRALMHKPDAIVLDGSMPVMDGWEVCRRIREQNATPIMMLTVHAERADRERAHTSGANDFLAKPFDINELISKVNGLLRLSHTRR